MAQPILTARWSEICILNFPAPGELLAPYVPPGLELEAFRGEYYLSLVAYQQSENQVFGFHTPESLQFPAIDLRCYIRCGSERGIRLIRRWLPSRLASWFQRLGFRDDCTLATLEGSSEKLPDAESPEQVRVDYSLELEGDRSKLHLEGREPPLMAPPGSLEHHFKEIRWCFGEDRGGQPCYYEIQHPQWFCYPVEGYELDWDWSRICGPEWDVLDDASPRSAVLAVGSEVCLFPNMKLE